MQFQDIGQGTLHLQPAVSDITEKKDSDVYMYIYMYVHVPAGNSLTKSFGTIIHDMHIIHLYTYRCMHILYVSAFLLCIHTTIHSALHMLSYMHIYGLHVPCQTSIHGFSIKM